MDLTRHRAPQANARAPAWFHVVQRGVGRRPVFTGADDVRSLLARLQDEASRTGIELHAYSVLTNHCHLLVRGPARAVSTAMRRVFAVYARRVNRRLRRDGPLFGSRCRIRRIVSERHWKATIAYIDRNAVSAGLVRLPRHYPHGSAWHYARSTRPDGLQRAVIEAHVCRLAGHAEYRPEDYELVFGPAAVPEGSCTVVARRMESVPAPSDPLDDLLAAAPADVRRWLEKMALRADGMAAGPTLVDPRTLLAVLDEERSRSGKWPLRAGRPGRRRFLTTAACLRPRRGGNRRDGWCVMTVGLLRAACGLTLDEISRTVGLSISGTWAQVGCHRDWLASDSLYGARAERVLQAALRRDYPSGAPALHAAVRSQ